MMINDDDNNDSNETMKQLMIAYLIVLPGCRLAYPD